MRIAAMAAGAVGGYFGARLAAAGHDVCFIARGAHLRAIRQNGLRIESVARRPAPEGVNATDDPAASAPVDMVLFAVKLWDTETAAEQARPLVGPDTRVITLQNGIDSVERSRRSWARRGDRRRRLYRDGDRRARASSGTPASSRGCGSAAPTGARRRSRVRQGCAGAGIDIALSGNDAGRACGRSSCSCRAVGHDRDPPVRSARSRRPGARAPCSPTLMRKPPRSAAAAGVALAADFVEAACAFVESVPAEHEGLDGARPRARQPARARLARRQGGGARPRARHADTRQRGGLSVLKLRRMGR